MRGDSRVMCKSFVVKDTQLEDKIIIFDFQLFSSKCLGDFFFFFQFFKRNILIFNFRSLFFYNTHDIRLNVFTPSYLSPLSHCIYYFMRSLIYFIRRIVFLTHHYFIMLSTRLSLPLHLIRFYLRLRRPYCLSTLSFFFIVISSISRIFFSWFSPIKMIKSRAMKVDVGESLRNYIE